MDNWWVYIVATLLVGPSFALPLFLYIREGKLELLVPAASNPNQGAQS